MEEGRWIPQREGRWLVVTGEVSGDALSSERDGPNAQTDKRPLDAPTASCLTSGEWEKLVFPSGLAEPFSDVPLPPPAFWAYQLTLSTNIVLPTNPHCPCMYVMCCVHMPIHS